MNLCDVVVARVCAVRFPSKTVIFAPLQVFAPVGWLSVRAQRWVLNQLPPKGVRGAGGCQFGRPIALPGQVWRGKMSAASGASFLLRASLCSYIATEAVLARAFGAPSARLRRAFPAHSDRRCSFIGTIPVSVWILTSFDNF